MLTLFLCVKGHLPSVITARPNSLTITIEFFHNIVLHHFLLATLVITATLPTLRPVHLVGFLDIVIAGTHQPQFFFQITSDVKVLGSCSKSLLLNFRGFFDELLVPLQVFPGDVQLFSSDR